MRHTRESVPAMTPALRALLAALPAGLLATLLAGSLSTPAAAAGVGVLRIDDFEDGDVEALHGLSWVVIADDLIGGASSAHLRPLAGGADGSSGALAIDGATAEGFPAPFVGAWTTVREGGLPRDLSALDGIRFWARGEDVAFMAGVRRGDGAGTANFMAARRAPREWTRFEIPFAELSQYPPAQQAMEWSPSGVSWIGFTSAPGHSGAFHLEIDRVEVYSEDRLVDTPFAVRKVRLAEPPVGLRWRPAAEEASGDGTSPRLPDARELAWATAPDGDRIWFRVEVESELPAGFFGINLAVDGDGDPDNGMAWWGSNSAFHFDRLVTAYLNRGEGYWQGQVGVADSAAVAEGRMESLGSDVAVALGPERRSVLVGVRRGDLDDDGRFRLIATVGSSMLNNDDLPNEGAVAIELEK